MKFVLLRKMSGIKCSDNQTQTSIHPLNKNPVYKNAEAQISLKRSQASVKGNTGFFFFKDARSIFRTQVTLQPIPEMLYT